MSLFINNNFCMLYIPTDVLSKVPATLPSSNTQLSERTVMVRLWHCFHLNYACIVSYKILTHLHVTSPFVKATARPGLAVCFLMNTSWSALVRPQCQSISLPPATWLPCQHTLWWLVQRPVTRLSRFSKLSRSVKIYSSFFVFLGHLQSNIYLHCILLFWCFKNSFDYHVMLYSNGWLYSEVSALNQAKKE